MKRLSENKVIKLAEKIEFPPLEIRDWRAMSSSQSISSSENFRPDYIVNMEWGNKSYKFIVEVRQQATPKRIDEAIYQLKKYTASKNSDNKDKYYPLLIAPYLNEERLERLAEEKISGVDLSGNGLVIIPGELFVYRSGAKNKFPSNAPIKNVFRGVSSIIPRVFFARTEYSSVSEILGEINKRSGTTTLATVSKVLKTLEEELLISRNGAIRLIDGKKLLKNLRENYRNPRTERSLIGKTNDLDKSLTRLSENADKNDFKYVIDEPRRYAVMATSTQTTKIYTENIDKALSGIEFKETSRFPNLEIIETQEPTVYFDRRLVQDTVSVYYTSPLQVYMELSTGGKREQETALQIAEGLLNFRY